MPNPRLHPLFVCLLAIQIAVSVAGDDFPKIYNSEPEAEAKPMAPAKAAESFSLPNGMSVSLFASEPGVQNPIAMAWDARGRLWVAENFTYAERARRFDLGLRDRVLIFEDTDWDGKADKRTVFTDEVQMLTSVAVGRSGVWLMCPPQLLFIPDRDGNGVPEGGPQVMLDGFTVAKNNYHNFANGLRWGPDGWLYGRCGGSCPGNVGTPRTPPENRIPIHGGIWRFHPERQNFEVLCHGTVNPWGHDWDRHGELFFINTVGGHLWHMIPGAQYVKPFGVSPNPLIFERIEMHADHWHFDTSGSWTKSRGGAANAFGGGHAHIGMTIYEGRHLPESFHGKLITWNMHGRRANMERLERKGSGYVAKHEPDVFLAGDEWFRGLEISTGPDGALYALDWSDTGECHEHTGVHRESGRIFRFSDGPVKKPKFVDYKNATPEEIDRWLRTENPWHFRRALEVFGTRGMPNTACESAVFKVAADSAAPDWIRLRGLWMMRALNAAPPFLHDAESEHLRAWAIRFVFDDNPIDTVNGPLKNADYRNVDVFLPKFVEMAGSDDSGLVRLTLASMLQRLPVEKRAGLAKALAAREEDARDHNMPKMVWFGISPLTNSRPSDLVEIAGATQWPDLLRWISRALASRIEKTPEPSNELIQLSLLRPEKAEPILAGFADAFRGWRKAPKPKSWDRLAEAVSESDSDPAGKGNKELADRVRDLSVLFGDGRAMEALRQIALDTEADLPSRETALQSLIESRAPGLRELCEKLIASRKINRTAVRGLALFDDPAIGENLAKNYRKLFWPQERSAAIDVLASRPEWAAALLNHIGEKKIPREDITPFHARQIQNFGEEKLTGLLTGKWGEIRQSDAAKRKRIEQFKARLTPKALAEADLNAGRLQYQTLCGTCHRLYGEGGVLGPDLTGSGRHDLDYLLENVIDPSAVVGANYRMTTFTLNDGRVLTGVIGREDARTITIRLLNEESVIEKSAIKERETLPVSIMPEGQIEAISPDQARDLLAYLMHPVQVPLPVK